MAPAAMAQAGGSNGGGGTTCANPAVNSGQPILLDLAESGVNDPSSSGTRLQSTKVADAIAFDAVDLSMNAAAKLALTKIEEWRKSPGSERSMALVEQGFIHMNFYLTPLEIHRLSRVALPPNSVCKLADLRTTILYRDGSANISIPAWNALGLLSQAGMFIHESLRNVQILQELDGTDIDLERVTMTVLMKTPGSTNLDQDVFFQKYIVETPKAKLELACSGLKNFLAKYPAVSVPLSADTEQLCSTALSLDGNENQELDVIRNGVENDLLTLGRSSADTQFAIDIARAYNPVDYLVSAILHQKISADDFLFRDLTSSINGVSTRIDLNLVRDFVNGKIKSSWWSPSRQQKVKDIRASLAQIRADYQRDLDDASDDK